jgi:hypothetical protein
MCNCLPEEGPSSTLTICTLSVDVRISLPTRCSIRKSWNTSGEPLNAVRKGDASSALTRSQKPESSVRSGWAFWVSKPTRQMLMPVEARSHVHHLVCRPLSSPQNPDSGVSNSIPSLYDPKLPPGAVQTTRARMDRLFFSFRSSRMVPEIHGMGDRIMAPWRLITAVVALRD